MSELAKMRIVWTKKLVLIFTSLVFMFFYVLLSHHNDIQIPNIYSVVENKINEKLKQVTVICSGTDPCSRQEQYEDDKANYTNTSNDGERLKYILQWTSPKNVPFVYMGKGRQGFIDRKCPLTNCYVTADRKYFGGDLTKFDVIAFAAPEVFWTPSDKLPNKRSLHQKYAFASIESSHYYPICSNKYDSFFNWTWTFRLNSEVRWGYMNIRNSKNNIVGPKINMTWIKFEDMDPITDGLKEQLKSKTKAAAWFVSNCHSRSQREKFVKNLQKELKRYNLTVDIYGTCGPFKCSRDNESECFKIIKKDYFFYLSFENSFSEDYVTEKLLNAVMNDAVPIVYGGANYSRFLPDRSYLNARELGVKTLANKMYQIINNPNDYYEYFRWKKYYSYHWKRESVDTDPYCLFCTTLNDELLVKERKVVKDFRKWWDPPGLC